MTVVDVWTGKHANALRTALRLTNEAFAEQLGTAVRTVAKWNANPELVPVPEMQRALDTLLGHAAEEAKARFDVLLGAWRRAQANAAAGLLETTASGEALIDPQMQAISDWLDTCAGWPPGTAAERVAAQVNATSPARVRRRRMDRNRVRHSQIASGIATLYAGEGGSYERYRANSSERTLKTSILTNPDWLDLRLMLGRGHDQLTLKPDERAVGPRLDEAATAAAIDRVAEMVTSGTRVFNASLYCLANLHIDGGRIDGCVRLADFASYALTMDLLEGELVDAVAEKGELRWADLPLRSAYLPSIEEALNFGTRLCAGGALALLAIARPASRTGRPADYALLVQERSGHVLNSARRLAVIPKAFHQPLADFTDDAQVSATLERELEEELLGRDELELAGGDGSYVDPMHLSRVSEPMRWLIERTGAWHMECTGFGVNLVSGNYEFASLIVIDDEEWWARYGGSLVTNWEAGGVRRYSSLDRDGIQGLLEDEAWSDEGLFAFVQGVRRLDEIGDRRVRLPGITQEPH